MRERRALNLVELMLGKEEWNIGIVRVCFDRG